MSFPIYVLFATVFAFNVLPLKFTKAPAYAAENPKDPYTDPKAYSEDLSTYLNMPFYEN
jgi:hypothetical protein